MLQATFEDGMVDEAIARNHSTTMEAIEVGDSAGVYRIILTTSARDIQKFQYLMRHTCIRLALHLT